jgi:predicted outer membrane lipoprotein
MIDLTVNMINIYILGALLLIAFAILAKITLDEQHRSGK